MNRFHGVISILLMAVSFLLGVLSIISKTILWGTIYFLILIFFFMVIIYIYCTKCPNTRNNSCKHIFPGYIAKLFPAKKQSGYAAGELLITVLSFLILAGFPQYWLQNNISLFILFWGLLILAVIDVLLFVCKGCFNIYCIMCPNKNNTVK
jgi:hypothetical protein